jgi:hypothetical protein
MKKIVIQFFLALLISCNLFAQDEIRCNSEEVLFNTLKNDKVLFEKFKKNEYLTQDWIKNNPNIKQRTIITIPVVVHLVYNPSLNIVLSDYQVKSQIDVLNEDFRRLNADRVKTPSGFEANATDCEIEFCLARRDPNNNSTTGIIRTITTQSSWTTNDDVKLASPGWNSSSYLNIWVCNLTGSALGIATFPNQSLNDGIIIVDRAFGRIGNLKPIYASGRTATHEVGHWLNAYHVWGDASGCSTDDNCNDTPIQDVNTSGVPSYPKSDQCSNSIMYMNYLDYTRDSMMNVYTNDQKARYIATLNGARISIQSSLGCNPPSVYTNDIAITDILSPALTLEVRNFSPIVRIKNNGISSIESCDINYQINNQSLLEYNWSGLLATGESADITLPKMRDSIGMSFFIAFATNINTNLFEEDTVNNFLSRSFFVPSDALDDPIFENKIDVYNNPSSGNYIIKFDSIIIKNFSLNVFNILGQRLSITYEQNTLNTLDLYLPSYAIPGFYFVRIKNGKKVYAAKLLKL